MEPLQRAWRSLEGLSVGDALGSLATVGDRGVPAGPWPYTDDTAMALALVEALQERGSIDIEDLFQRFALSYEAQPHRGYGMGMMLLFDQVRQGTPRAQAAGELFGEGSFGNGAAMRVGPLGAYFAEDYDRVVEQARASALTTHAHPEGVAGAIAIAVAAAAAVRGEPDLIGTVLKYTPPGPTRDGIERARRPWTSPQEAARELGNGQQVTSQDTVPFCLWCISNYRHSYVECFWATLAGQGDRDTNCAITGSVVALMTSDLPPEWVAAREPLSARTPRDIARQWAAAYNRHDAQAAAALYDAQVKNFQLPWGKIVEGHEAMRQTYVRIFAAFPDIQVDILELLEDGPRAVVEWRFRGTMLGEFAGHPPNQRSFDMRGCEVFEVRDGKIVSQRGYWDKATMFSQLQLVP